ncbi:hypothetical protein HYS00_04625 [Candidatus Microgenomates bacterium]|nr:hypothetical protein [Candidatus Microgenomates bacterium]
MAKTKSQKNMWNTVTPFSKTLAMILFVSLPIIAFIWGMNIGFDMQRALAHPAVETSYIR